ncbi:unnamed protein product [Cyprideis torosa]|uniref:Bifunctional glutamate/proline--tRNA ligase n=1 Tax=Cyprideis torosa TaxID=163714 RepID=A0A7R8WCY0_9CRUS|nr:unnamed protein product [Cyprideis torosa]CAG0891429.1 unnamed protein product [Cyprideis torosa]
MVSANSEDEVDFSLTVPPKKGGSCDVLVEFLHILKAKGVFVTFEEGASLSLRVGTAVFNNEADVLRFVARKLPTLALYGNGLLAVTEWASELLTKTSGLKTPVSSTAAPKSKETGKQQQKGAGPRKEEGKFVDLPGAKMGEVVVRFPPEASGFLHIGHAKAALLNRYYQEMFQGKLIMRFDDTNPDKENAHFEKVILEDVATLGLRPDVFSFTSDYFGKMLEMGEQLIADGKAYVDDTPAELMKEQRERMEESAARSRSVAENLSLWQEMKAGTAKGMDCCVRAKIDMKSPNGCMRDPTIFRCKTEPHLRTKTTYKVYPTYDFACPIVDSIEGVTHALRTTEYKDRDEQYTWFCKALGIREPYIYSYSRLNMSHTVLSKRKLTWFVQQGKVTGWDDPRMPTVRGMLRRGLTVDALREFIIAQGSSKAIVLMEWDKLWSINKKFLDPVVPRYTALDVSEGLVSVEVSGAGKASLKVPLHPKKPEGETKEVRTGPKLLLEKADVGLLSAGSNATFINWGNLLVESVPSSGQGVIKAKLNLGDTNFKKTAKVTWLADAAENRLPIRALYFDHLLSKASLRPGDEFTDFVGHETMIEIPMVGEESMKELKAGDIIQVQRKGFFKVDVPYSPPSPNSCKEGPIVMFFIPDGSASKGPFDKITSSTKPAQETASSVTATPCDDVALQIKNQGDVIRDLKAKKVDKKSLEPEIKKLLDLKTQFKAETGRDWKPEDAAANAASSATNAATSSSSSGGNVAIQIKEQGDRIRDLKTQKVDKKTLEPEIKKLLDLKAEFKTQFGRDWKPEDSATNAANSATNAATSSSSSGGNVAIQIKEQGDRIRDLKAQKVDKKTLEPEIKKLLDLKAEFKTQFGRDWKPEDSANVVIPAANVAVVTATSNVASQIKEQGDKIRDMKAQKVDKKTLEPEIKRLLDLKAEFKNQFGRDWKPEDSAAASTNAVASVTTAPASDTTNETQKVFDEIKQQGDKIREMKSKKSTKSEIDSEVKTLLALKAKFKEVSGMDWKPDLKLPEAAVVGSGDAASAGPEEALSAAIKAQGDVVRNLKSSKAPKNEIDAAVQTLLKLKADFKQQMGKEWKPPEGQAAGKASKKEEKPKPQAAKKKEETPPAQQQPAATGGVKKVTRLGMEAKKAEDLPDWYQQVITKAELIEYYDVSGCYILRPWAFSIWEGIMQFVDKEIKKLGVQNCYFPIFVSKSALEKEKTHVEDFAPEVAWVTHSGDTALAEPIAIRPTSETVMYPSYAKWIQSHRDLPIKLNQWNSVVRWEFKHPQPFLRTREFLWQEGHTAHASLEEAEEEVYQILDIYRRVYEELLAIPVKAGRKTEKEKFAGADFTTTVEAFISASGRAIQGGTSHHLGQNFSKMFEIVFDDPVTQEKRFVYQNSWGITTRTIGVMIMIHGDDQGLILPPRVAAIQVVVIPCGLTATLAEEVKSAVVDKCKEVEERLRQAGVRVRGDYRDNYSPGWKFNHWELKGVPVRLEIGPQDLSKKQCMLVRRHKGLKQTSSEEAVVDTLQALLETIHADMFQEAKRQLDSHIKQVKTWSDFCSELESSNLLLAPYCGREDCEDAIKKDSAKDVEVEPGAPAMGAKGLCIPFEQPSESVGSKCVHHACTHIPKKWTLFGRSY